MICKTYLIASREVVNALGTELGLDAEAVARLHGVSNDDDAGVLEEVRAGLGSILDTVSKDTEDTAPLVSVSES